MKYDHKAGGYLLVPESKDEDDFLLKLTELLDADYLERSLTKAEIRTINGYTQGFDGKGNLIPIEPNDEIWTIFQCRVKEFVDSISN